MQKASEQDKQKDAPDQEKASRQWGRSVGVRTVTAAVAIPIVLAALWLGGWWAFVIAALATGLSLYELYVMLLHEGYHPVILISAALSALFLVTALLLPQQRFTLLEIGISVALVVTFLVLFFRKKLDGAMLDWTLTLAIAFYVGWPMSFLLLLRGSQMGMGSGLWWLCTVFGGVWGFDTGAFFAGHFFGRHKLAPQISPGKTWEGVFGGLIFSIAAALLFTTLAMGVPWYLAVPLGIALGSGAVLGDLAESLIKRQTHVKDSGHFMPGQGGMLDRLDSILFAVLVVYIFAQLLGRV